MLLLIFVILFAAGVACLIAYYEKERKARKKSIWERTLDDDHEWLFNIGWVGVSAFGVAIAISVVVIIGLYTTADAEVAEAQERYKSLTYQLENNLYDNDNDIGKKALYDDIRDYNEKIAYNQKIQDDFWIGIYCPDVWDQLELIDYSTGK
jgi:hypothetical protein